LGDNSSLDDLDGGVKVNGNWLVSVDIDTNKDLDDYYRTNPNGLDWEMCLENNTLYIYNDKGMEPFSGDEYYREATMALLPIYRCVIAFDCEQIPSLFMSSSQIKSIDMPDTINYIGDGFLLNCALFEGPLTIPPLVTIITGSFLQGSGIKEPPLFHENIREIHGYVLAATPITTVPVIPLSIHYIGSDFLCWCKNIQSCTIDLSQHKPLRIGSGFMKDCGEAEINLKLNDITNIDTYDLFYSTKNHKIHFNINSELEYALWQSNNLLDVAAYINNEWELTLNLYPTFTHERLDYCIDDDGLLHILTKEGMRFLYPNAVTYVGNTIHYSRNQFLHKKLHELNFSGVIVDYIPEETENNILTYGFLMDYKNPLYIVDLSNLVSETKLPAYFMNNTRLQENPMLPETIIDIEYACYDSAELNFSNMILPPRLEKIAGSFANYSSVISELRTLTLPGSLQSIGDSFMSYRLNNLTAIYAPAEHVSRFKAMSALSTVVNKIIPIP
jgi:hypothetical protein